MVVNTSLAPKMDASFCKLRLQHIRRSLYLEFAVYIFLALPNVGSYCRPLRKQLVIFCKRCCLFYLLSLYLPFSKINRSFHQRFAKQISSAVTTSDWFWVLYPGLCSKYHSIHGSFSGNQGDHHTGHTRSTPTRALKTMHIK